MLLIGKVYMRVHGAEIGMLARRRVRACAHVTVFSCSKCTTKCVLVAAAVHVPVLSMRGRS